MLNQNENKLLFLIKTVPIFIIILFSISITIFSLYQNNSFFEEEINKVKDEYLKTSKQRIKDEVGRVYKIIENVRKNTETSLKENIKQRVEEAHSIANRIYKENIGKPNDEIIKMIKDALRDIRFNDGRGYYFAYQMDGVNVLLPENEELEGKSFWNFKDARGGYTIQAMTKIVEKEGSGFHTWWWYKPRDKKTQYKKIGYGKYFEPLDWFIGTGEYVEDFKKNVQKDLLNLIQKVRYGKNGYVFVVDKNGVYLSHVAKDYIDKNRIDLRDKNGFMITKEIIETAKKGEGYIQYIGTFQPTTGKAAEKITYVKGFEDWEWSIASGTYLSDLKEVVEEKKQNLKRLNKLEIEKMITFSIIVTVIFVILSYIFAKIIEKRFLVYQKLVEDEIIRNRQKDEIMFQQSKMAAMGEMLENIAHQWRQPLSAISMNASGLQLRMDLEEVDKSVIDKVLDNIVKSTMFLSRTIEDFRNFFKSDKKQTEFNLKDTLEQSIKIVDSKFKNRDIKVFTTLEDIKVYGSNNELVQVLMNILNNARDILENKKEDEERVLQISISKDNENALIKIHDNGGGVADGVAKKIFDPYFTTKHQSQGTGIGLYMSREIVVKHFKGTIEVENKPFEYNGKSHYGAMFTITIPCK